MQAVELQTAFGIDSLHVVERPKPQPGPGQVLIAWEAWSLNYRDLLMVKGQYNPKLRFPFTPLSDGSGRVVEVGSGVTRVKVGDRVAGNFMQTWLDGEVTETIAKSALGGALPGILEEYSVLSAEGVVPIPEHLSTEEAATLPCAAVTAWNALVAQGNIQAGETVLVQGTGGVSLFALQFAKSRGVKVIATSSSDEKLARVKRMGADELINYKTTPEWGARVVELTGGRGVDHVVEVGGAGTLGQSLRAVRMGGTISLIGVLAAGPMGQFNPTPILMRHIRLQGIFVGNRAMFETMNSTISEHKLHPVIDRVFEFSGIQSALKHMESGSHFGKIVIRRKA